MNVRDIPTAAVDSYLKVVRLPLDGAIRLLPGNGNGPGRAAKVALDRADATVRSLIGALLSDQALRDDAARRRVAADERERAWRLHAEARRQAQEADAKLEERRGEAGREREQARRQAERERASADRQRDRRVAQTDKDHGERLEHSRATAERVQEAIKNRAAMKRVEALDAKRDALLEREEELALRDEADRLGRAAARAQAERKRG